jgi:hypothetical protein
MPTGVYKRKPMSDETKRKIGLANSIANKGKPSHNKGLGSYLLECKTCSKEFTINKYAFEKNGEGKYCSRDCYTESKKGIVPPHLVGMKFVAWNKGKKGISGENHYNWKGGVTSENKRIRGHLPSKIWRESVFKRDNWTCQKCHNRDGKPIHPHHILNFSSSVDLRFSTSNGVTLHKDCHLNFHKEFGFRNNTKEQIDKYLA